MFVAFEWLPGSGSSYGGIPDVAWAVSLYRGKGQAQLVNDTYQGAILMVNRDHPALVHFNHFPGAQRFRRATTVENRPHRPELRREFADRRSC